MKQILTSIQTQLATITSLRHIDKNWNQLNYEQPPVKYPCALIDIQNVDYTQMSQLHQVAVGDVEITIANMQLTNSSYKNPNRNDGFEIFTLLDEIHQALQGFAPTNAQPLVRTNLQKVDSSNNYEIYRMTYRTSWNVEKIYHETKIQVEPKIIEGNEW